MTGAPDHRVKRVVFDLRCPDQAAAFAARTRLVAMVDEAVVPALDQALSLHATDEIQRIERIEIDLGRLNLDRLDPARIRAAIAEALSRRLRQRREPSVTFVSSAVSLADSLSAFLASGTLPWPAVPLAELERRALTLAPTEAAGLVERLRPLLRGEMESLRFALQFSTAFLMWVVRRLQPMARHEIAALPSRPTPARRARAHLVRAAATLPVGASAAQLSERVRDAAATPLRDMRAPARAVPRAQTGHAAAAVAAARPEATGARDAPGEDALYVGNAGIVLLHPFLPRFFAELGLLDAHRQFRTRAARERAVHLMHFLSCGEEHPEEPATPLHKLLCGLPFEQPIVRRLRLRDDEKEEAERLLTAAIDHWQKLGSASPEGLREAFLRRDGKLERTDRGWVLTVEQRAIDILLDHLPWALSVVRLPWMAEPLQVNWG